MKKLPTLLVWFWMGLTALPTVAGQLQEAARVGDLTTLEHLLKQEPPPKVDEVDPQLQVTAWQVARYHGRLEAAELLARAGADTNRAFPTPEEMLDRVLGSRIKEGQPGFAVRVSRGGQLLFEKGYGTANLETHEAIAPQTVFRIGSVTKQFTAAAVLLCEHEAMLSTSDPLTKFFPGFPGGDKITLQHLLNHTSGLGNYTSLPGFMEHVTEPRTPEQMLAAIRGAGAEFEPGERFEYCNSGYFLLAEVVRRVTGAGYDEFLQDRVFLPEKMFTTGLHRPQLSLAHEAVGLAWEDGRWGRAVDWHMSQAGGAGEAYSTVGDLDRWSEAVFGGRVLPPETLKKAHQPWKPPGQASVGGQAATEEAGDEGLNGNYACGWVVDHDRGQPRIWHSGGLHGFTSRLCRYPQQKLTVAVLSNSMEPVSGLTVASVADLAARQYLWRSMDAQPCFRELPLPEGVKLADYEGAFDFGGAGVMRFRVKEGRLEGKLATQSWGQVRSSGADEFREDAVGAVFVFHRNDKRAVTHLTLKQHGAVIKGEKFTEPEPGAVDRASLAALAGTYELPFGKMEFRVDDKSGELRGRVAMQPEFAYFPVKGDAQRYFCKAVRVQVMFIRPDGAKDGPATGLIIQQGGGMMPGRRISANQ